MKMFFLFPILMASASVKPVDNIWQRKMLTDKCVNNQKEVRGWFADGSRPETETVPLDKIDRAFALLDTIQFPSTEDVKIIQTSLKSDFGENYLKWVGVAEADCPQMRLSLVRPLVNTAEKNPKLKEKIATRIKSLFEATKYPSLLGVSIDGLLLEYGVQHGLWKGTVTADVSKMRGELKQEVKKFRTQYADLLTKLEIKDTSPDSIQKFKTTKDLGKIKDMALSEFAMSEKYFREMRELSAKLD